MLTLTQNVNALNTPSTSTSGASVSFSLASESSGRRKTNEMMARVKRWILGPVPNTWAPLWAVNPNKLVSVCQKG